MLKIRSTKDIPFDIKFLYIAYGVGGTLFGMSVIVLILQMLGVFNNG